MGLYEPSLRKFFSIQIIQIRSANWHKRNEDFRDEISAITRSMFHGTSVEGHGAPLRNVLPATREQLEERCSSKRMQLADAEAFVDWLIGSMDNAIQMSSTNSGQSP